MAKFSTTFYAYAMNRRNPISLRALLLLLLAVGPLQAQSIFVCAMMDTVVEDPCCCSGHDAVEDNRAWDQDVVVLESSEDPCCERSVQLTVDQDAGQATPISKSAELRSDIDPPQSLLSSIDVLIPPQPVVTIGVSHLDPAAGHSGSDTWLITQRLRI